MEQMNQKNSSNDVDDDVDLIDKIEKTPVNITREEILEKLAELQKQIETCHSLLLDQNEKELGDKRTL